MSFSNEEKYKIYLAEKARIEKEENERKKQLFEEKLSQLSEEEKKKIYHEIKEQKIVYVGENDIKYPKITDKTIGWILGLGFLLSFIFISMVGAFVIGIIAAIVIVVLQLQKVFITSPEIQYKCPDCNHHHSLFLRSDEKMEAQSNGFIKAACHNCGESFRVVVEESILDIVTVK